MPINEKISLYAPVVESFLDIASAAKVWPESVATNKIFLAQIIRRHELRKYLANVADRLPRPDMTLEDAIGKNYVQKDQVIGLYTALSDLLEWSLDYRRIVLYLPFEFLPSKAWEPAGELGEAVNRFRRVYVAAWFKLLSVHDVRANFVDGDIIEVDYRTSLPRVVKAAHFIPKLVEIGLLDVGEIAALADQSEDSLLKASIADALSVLADPGYLSGNNTPVWNNERMPKAITLESVQGRLESGFSFIEAKTFGRITKKRIIWLKQESRRKLIESLGKEIGAAIIRDSFSDKAANSFISAKADASSRQALIGGIRNAIEHFAFSDRAKARELYSRYERILLEVWDKDPETKEELLKTFRRLNVLGIADDGLLAELNIHTPYLAGPFSLNLKPMEEEISGISKLLALAAGDSELSRFIYPVVLVFGSHLKGYGARNADIDLAVFVKPGTLASDKERMKKRLKEVFVHERISGDIVEFWLKDRNEELEIIDFKKPDSSLGESWWVHILFGAAWLGEENAAREIRSKLLVPYMRKSDRKIDGYDARRIWLEEMESEVLQYRLMHKGYANFFPACGGISTACPDRIDAHSMFWDSGYRQLATRLFINMVFLPIVPGL